MDKVLRGHTAVITGAARGQGAAEARLFHAEGASLVLTDLLEEGAALAAELGERAIFVRHDVVDRASWDHVAEIAHERFGIVDILVNNAGITGYESVEEITPAMLQRYLDIHLFGALHGIQTLLPLMTRGVGSIIDVASTAALRGSPGYCGYGVSKWALRGLGRYAARDLVSRGIRVNTIMPGGVDTPMLIQPNGQDMIQSARRAVPMGRFAAAEEIARVALFLASDASSYMTGAELVVDGGLSC